MARAVEKYFPTAGALKVASMPAVYDSKSRSSSLAGCGPTSELEVSSGELNALPPYISMVATVLYFAVLSRPDIIYHATFLARFATNANRQCYVRPSPHADQLPIQFLQ